MLNKITVRDKARVLLNELSEGFFKNSQLEGFCDDAAIDISTKTYCYEQSAPITLTTGNQLYTAPSDIVKTLGMVYNSKGLTSATPWMEGIQTAVATGPPKYYFEIINKYGFMPVPTITENGSIVTVYYAKTTDNITNIPLKFQVPAVLFVLHLALAKDKQYTKSGQVYQLYLASLNLDRTEVVADKIQTPEPRDHYILKLFPAQVPQGR